MILTPGDFYFFILIYMMYNFLHNNYWFGINELNEINRNRWWTKNAWPSQ